MEINANKTCENCININHRLIKAHPKQGIEVHCVNKYIIDYDNIKFCPHYKSKEKEKENK
jgi:hypothetical protein